MFSLSSVTRGPAVYVPVPTDEAENSLERSVPVSADTSAYRETASLLTTPFDAALDPDNYDHDGHMGIRAGQSGSVDAAASRNGVLHNPEVASFRLGPASCDLKTTLFVLAAGFVLVLLLDLAYQFIPLQSSSPLLSPMQRQRDAQLSVDCWQRGEWLYDSGRSLEYEHYNVCPRRACHNGGVDTHKWRWRPWGTRHFHPNEPWRTTSDDDDRCPHDLLDFSSSDFCLLLDGRNIMIVGDSLSNQFHDTLLLAAQPASRQLQRSANLCHDSNCSGHLVCDGSGYRPSSVRFFRSYDLGTRTNWLPTNESFGSKNSYEPWLPHLREYHILLINRGLHYTDDAVFSNEVATSLQLVRTLYPDLLILWRSTVPGHWNCSNITSDGASTLSSPWTQPLLARYASTNGSLVYPERRWSSAYGWDKIAPQNLIARRLVEDPAVRGIFLDVLGPTELRHDAHMTPMRDCLHYCQPGPLDTWVVLFYNVLRVVLRSE